MFQIICLLECILQCFVFSERRKSESLHVDTFLLLPHVVGNINGTKCPKIGIVPEQIVDI